MNLYVKNHNFHFELENLTRLFFPNEKITVIRDFSGPQPPCIYTEVSDKITISVNIGSFNKSETAVKRLTDDDTSLFRHSFCTNSFVTLRDLHSRGEYLREFAP